MKTLTLCRSLQLQLQLLFALVLVLALTSARLVTARVQCSAVQRQLGQSALFQECARVLTTTNEKQSRRLGFPLARVPTLELFSKGTSAFRLLKRRSRSSSSSSSNLLSGLPQLLNERPSLAANCRLTCQINSNFRLPRYYMCPCERASGRPSRRAGEANGRVALACSVKAVLRSRSRPPDQPDKPAKFLLSQLALPLPLFCAGHLPSAGRPTITLTIVAR